MKPFDIDAQGFVFLPDRRHGVVGSFLYAGVRVRDWTDPRWPETRVVELAGTEPDGLTPDDVDPADYGDRITLRLDRDGVLGLAGELLDLADRIDRGEVRG